ncbi:phosphoribosylformylglycinamidine synthase subunit PurQ [Deferribacterales bacterium Es71-Z0220]|jgi:phosphoribosylformylglycinamidine synthase|uniref:phosphoribosylformylglycinamidine synthase subunit PurQ n=1 Tax=Deferrivibrio essentukiensis TaxID=2880922 RepID=UPI001F602885|nr:phosphoribosylformylglycinamidine synthase subunit PurQ [Deferrivibrio essentukiensis]MBZ4672028.1 phosphoribosylformylglycinamidine synthase subunit [Deferribacteraceae bacterium]MCB4205028.1 phosphoribosylformylglycinamidine synthase subunit PurQ [Deferrivibrio essentukiensis]
MKAGVVVFPGSNCDHDCYHVLKHVLEIDTVFLWHKDKELKDVDFIVLPGGFSYGDYLRCGAIASQSEIIESVIDFAEKGGLVLGICNGFQILTETGLLPGALLRNRDLKFICKDVNLVVSNVNTPFTKFYSSGEVIKIPIAHMDGNYFIDEPGLADLIENEQIVFRYCNDTGETLDDANPNGSIDNIAGIINKKGNVLGMMPHPERCAEEILGNTDGIHIFNSVKKFLKGGI